MNIVFSTTRQWNPGDEFILMGVINLLKNYFEENLENKYFNSIIYNRNPQIRRARKRDVLKMIDNMLGKEVVEKFKDNSVKDRLPMDYADLVVFAGSPEWSGRRLFTLYQNILDYNLPTIFLGIGTGGYGPVNFNSFADIEQKVFTENTHLVTTRDANTYNAFKDFKFAKQLPCPALFSSTEFKEVKKVKKIALIYSTSNAVGGNHVVEETYKYIKSLYRHLIDKYQNQFEFEFVAHYIDELSEFKKDFPSETLCYSYDSKDYLDIYSRFDFVLGCRVHGIGMCASMGIPGIMVAHDPRSETVKGFLSERIFVNDNIEDVDKLLMNSINNVEKLNYNLKVHKEKTLEQYSQMMKEHLKINV